MKSTRNEVVVYAVLALALLAAGMMMLPAPVGVLALVAGLGAGGYALVLGLRRPTQIGERGGE